MRRLTTCIAALVLVIAGCGDDDDTAATTTTTTTAETTTTVEDPTTTTTSTTTTPERGPELRERCTSPDGFTISYPQGWEAVADCGQFGPAPLDEPAPNTDDRTGAVAAYLDPVAFEQVSGPDEGERDRREATVDGRPAVRVEGAQSGIGLYPEGTDYARWMVDVDGERTLFLDTYDLDGYDVDFDEAVAAMDAMAESIDLDG
jgi:hypothetical protein